MAIDVLFYGNSYTNVFQTTSPNVPDLFAEIAVAAGQFPPNAVNAAVDGKDFSWHLANNRAPIFRSLETGESWDFVVMQNFSTRPTLSHPGGDRAQHRADAVLLYEDVAGHSPDVTPVLFETWAREAGSPDLVHFPGGPAQMQAELREGYALAAADIDAFAGEAITRVASVGDAWEAAGYEDLHHPDRTHPNLRGRLLTALVIYSTVYGDDTRDLFLTGGLDTTLLGMGLDAADGAELTLVSDATAGVTRQPGDADASGVVDLLDFDILAAGFGAGPGYSGGADGGDFNFDGVVDLLDFDILAQNFGASSPAVVPEPASFAALGVTGLLAARRRLGSRASSCD
ncbi:MAG: hypothetical protein AAF612_07605 [Planctomycetota bacterium]